MRLVYGRGSFCSRATCRRCLIAYKDPHTAGRNVACVPCSTVVLTNSRSLSLRLTEGASVWMTSQPMNSSTSSDEKFSRRLFKSSRAAGRAKYTVSDTFTVCALHGNTLVKKKKKLRVSFKKYGTPILCRKASRIYSRCALRRRLGVCDEAESTFIPKRYSLCRDIRTMLSADCFFLGLNIFPASSYRPGTLRINSLSRVIWGEIGTSDVFGKCVAFCTLFLKS